MKKILIIEDEKVLPEVLGKRLGESGYEVLLALDGVEGLQKIKQDKPSLVLLDLIMPKKGGFEVLAEMRRNPSFMNIPVIVITNSGQAEEIERAMKLGAADYLIKTEFEPETAMQKIEKILGGASV